MEIYDLDTIKTIVANQRELDNSIAIKKIANTYESVRHSYLRHMSREGIEKQAPLSFLKSELDTFKSIWEIIDIKSDSISDRKLYALGRLELKDVKKCLDKFINDEYLNTIFIDLMQTKKGTL